MCLTPHNAQPRSRLATRAVLAGRPLCDRNSGGNLRPGAVVRARPYTAIGIRRVPCARCGKPSTQQWNVCALGKQYFGVCDACDVGLNRAALEYMRWPDREAIMESYSPRRTPREQIAKDAAEFAASPEGKLTQIHANRAVRQYLTRRRG